MKYDELYLWYLADPVVPRLVGQLRLIRAGNGVSLQYDDAWINDGFPLSEDLILSGIEHLPRWKGLAVGAVDDARPDRWGERVIQFLDKPERLSLMEYLYFAGDDRFGALGVSTSATSYCPRQSSSVCQLSDAQKLSEIVRKIVANETLNEIERHMMAGGGSIGGVKPKALVRIDNDVWIMKFFNGEPVDVPLIEYATMTLAAKAGIQVASTMVVRLDHENALAVRRFDREDGKRIHCLSAGTALRAQTVEGNDPVFGYPQLAQLLRRVGEVDANQYGKDMAELFRRMIFNILIDNTDDHEKNHALQVLSPMMHGRYRLAPAYDVLPSNSGQGHQQFVVGDAFADSTLDNAMSQCRQFGLSIDEASKTILEVIDVIDGWQDHFREIGVTENDIASLKQTIDGSSLLEQRKAFRLQGYIRKDRKSKRNSWTM